MKYEDIFVKLEAQTKEIAESVQFDLEDKVKDLQ